MNYSSNHTAASMSMNDNWDIGASIVTAFEAGGLTLALIIFLIWVIRIVIVSRRTTNQGQP